MLEIDGVTLLSRLIRSLEPLVPRIQVVIGYREEMVIELCAREHRNVALVRNTEFRTTNTAESMALGARSCHGKTLFLDGDLLIDPVSLRNFVGVAKRHNLLMGICTTQSENPVCVRLDPEAGEPSNGDLCQVLSFTRSQRHAYEWANVVAGPHDLMAGVRGFVFERLLDYAPISAKPIELCEIDTKADLELAYAFARELHARSLTARDSPFTP